MEFTRCLRCMKEANSYPCSHCGYDPRADKPKEYVLRPGTILNGKYVVGTPLGQGGFGITYIGWDLLLNNRVAIKEYFPSGQVGRSTGGTLHWYSTPQAETARDSGKEMFLKEARKMSRVGSVPQVVHIRDLFQQNDTAYIVMDFVEGETLMARLKRTGPLTWGQAQTIFFPAIRAMEQVHQEGLIHRDLSPDNLMLLPNGDVCILDLGAAKDLTINSGASSMQVAKGGFSPLEQYTQRGGSGTWSDVYAMAATMYYSLTGVLPPPVMDRMEDDQIRWNLPGLKDLPKPALEALKKAMFLLAKDRTQTMGEFLNQLESAIPRPKPTPKPKPTPIPDSDPDSNSDQVLMPSKKTMLAAIAAVLVVALISGWMAWLKQEAELQLKSQPQTEAQMETAVPTEPKIVFPLSRTVTEQTIAAGLYDTVAIKNGGSIIGWPDSSGDIGSWDNIIAISVGKEHIVGLRADGTVVATGNNSYGQCNVSWWTNNVVAVSAGNSYTVGLKADGTVVAVGANGGSQCNVSDWTDIVAVSAGFWHTVGLKADGTVVTAGDSDDGQCDVSDWRNIVAVSAGSWHMVGLKADGTVVATGDSDNDQCNVSDWADIVAISAGAVHTVGLKADGTVVATGGNKYGQCDVSNWSDIVAISAGGWHTVGLKADGTVVVVGDSLYDVSGWTDIRIPGTTE